MQPRYSRSGRAPPLIPGDFMAVPDRTGNFCSEARCYATLMAVVLHQCGFWIGA